MQNTELFSNLDEKAIEIILNFQASSKYDKDAEKELLNLKESIKKSIVFLPEEEQKIIELRFFENLSFAEIENKVQKSKDEIEKLLSSGISKIKKSIKNPQVLFEDNKSREKESKKKSAGEIDSKKLAYFAGFLSIVVFLTVFFVTYALIQKYFSNQMLSFNQPSNFINSLFQSFTTPAKVVKSKKLKKGSNPNDIKISGSTSLISLSKKWQDAFSIEFPKYKISLIPSDSNEGINALISGNVDIANSSRPLSYSDIKLAQDNDLELAEYRVALDALVILANKINPIMELSLNDLKRIFNGEVKNWNELSPFSSPVLPIAREIGSGTNDFVVNRILDGNDFPDFIQRKKSNQEIDAFISQNPGAISYINSGNYPWESKHIKHIKIKNFEDSLSFSAFESGKLNEQAIRYGDYPLSHYLYLITLENYPKKTEVFINWVLSPSGQQVVKYSGLIPVSLEDK